MVNKNGISIYQNLSLGVHNQKQIKFWKFKMSLLVIGSLLCVSFTHPAHCMTKLMTWNHRAVWGHLLNRTKMEQKVHTIKSILKAIFESSQRLIQPIKKDYDFVTFAISANNAEFILKWYHGPTLDLPIKQKLRPTRKPCMIEDHEVGHFIMTEKSYGWKQLCL